MSRPHAPTDAMRDDVDGLDETERSNREESYNRYLIHELEILFPTLAGLY